MSFSSSLNLSIVMSLFSVMTPLKIQHISAQSKPSLSKQMIVERKRKWKDIKNFSLPLPKYKNSLHFMITGPFTLERYNSFQISMCMRALTDGRGGTEWITFKFIKAKCRVLPLGRNNLSLHQDRLGVTC